MHHASDIPSTVQLTVHNDDGNQPVQKTIAGHRSLEMVKRYIKIAQTNLQKAHRDASPVMNWLL